MFDFLPSFWFWFRIISATISAIFLVIVIRYIIITDAFRGYKEYKLNVYKFGNEEKKRIVSRWDEILELIQSKKPKDWKKAILYADDIFDDLLRMNRYEGMTQAERLENINTSQIENINELRAAREQVFSLFFEDKDVDQKSAKELLREYREVFRKMGYL